jgi:hypothetical protein
MSALLALSLERGKAPETPSATPPAITPRRLIKRRRFRSWALIAL